jgi:prepilin-type N-terminal cleavage/methylation domain-containing protein/prepilin-type processing-associated H-X9-DG protein
MQTRRAIPGLEGEAPQRRGFTLLETLVVMAIIAVLIGLLAPALGGAKRRAFKSAEMNRIKNVGHAWMLYAQNQNDAVVPGYLSAQVQNEPLMGVSRGWGVTYKYPDNSAIPLNATNLTGPWTWRLLSYLSYDHGCIHGHLSEAVQDKITLVTEGVSVPYEPGFGYNGYYIGGWWDMENIEGVLTPRYRYYNHCNAAQTRQPISVPQSISQITRSSEMLTFCSSSLFASGGSKAKLPGDIKGFHLVMPPMMEQTQRWRPNAGDMLGAVDVLVGNTAAPIGRYTGAMAVLYADGHVDQQGYNALNDQRLWINSADTADYGHRLCTPPED